MLLAVAILLLFYYIVAKRLNGNCNNQKQNSYHNPEWRRNEDDLFWEHNQTSKSQNEHIFANDTNSGDSIDFGKSYQRKYLLTVNELHAYKSLRSIADIKGYTVLAKVRLLDIIEPRRSEKKYKTLLYKIQAKHVDFVITDKEMHIKAIIELDDNSHKQNSRKERDDFVNLILRSVGYTIIHTKYITNDILDVV